MKAFVFIESNTSGTGELSALAARAKGLDVFLAARSGENHPLVNRHDFPVLCCDTGDPSAVLDAMARAGIVPIAVHTTSEYFVHVAAQVAIALKLPGPVPAAIEICRDKGRQRETLRSVGVPVPEHLSCSTQTEVSNALSKIVGPWVVKPSHGSGSIGVRLFEDSNEAAKHAAYLLSPGQHAPTGSNQRVLVEKYVDGSEYSVEIFEGEVVACVQKLVSPHPHFIETGHCVPAEAGAGGHPARLQQRALQAVSAVGLSYGAQHVELRWTGSEAVVIEVNPRLAGGQLPVVLRHAAGVDLIDATIDLAMGGNAKLATPFKQVVGTAIGFLLVTERSCIRIDEIPDEILELPGVVGAEIYRDSGDSVEPHWDFRDRVGHVIAQSSSCDGPRQNADAALATLREIVLEPAP